MKNLGSRLLDFALCVLTAVLLLTWAWHLIRPLVPVLAIAGAVAIFIVVLVRRNRSW